MNELVFFGEKWLEVNRSYIYDGVKKHGFNIFNIKIQYVILCSFSWSK